MKAKELRDKTRGELEKLLQENQAKLCQLRFDVSARQEKNYRQIKLVKKDIARIISILTKEKPAN